METVLDDHTSPYIYLSLYWILSFLRCLHVTVSSGLLGSEVLGPRPADEVRFKFGLSIWYCSSLVAYCTALTRTVPGVIGGVA